MSADRELLELAAKAAGQERSAAGDLWSNARGLPWNPLTDDGDCARMEAALLIELLWHDGGVQAGRRCDPFAVYEDFDGRDRNTVRRRVSVELAARIGKEMP